MDKIDRVKLSTRLLFVAHEIDRDELLLINAVARLKEHKMKPHIFYTTEELEYEVSKIEDKIAKSKDMFNQLTKELYDICAGN